jgi:hypothetical protein
MQVPAFATRFVRHLPQHENGLALGHASHKARIHRVIHRTRFRTVLHSPCAIRIVKDLDRDQLPTLQEWKFRSDL